MTLLRYTTALLLSLWATSALSQAVLGGANIPTQPQRPPAQSIGGEANWYIDWTSGNVFGPKSSGAWPQTPLATLTNSVTIPPQSGDASIPINAALQSGTKVQLACGTYTVLNTITMSTNTELSGAGPCTVIVPGQTIAGNAQWANVNLDPTYATIISNSDMTNGNTNISVHDLKIDISSTDTNGRKVWGIGFGKTTFVHVYNNSIIGKGPTSTGQDGTAFVQSSHYVIDHNYVYGVGNACYDQWNGVSDLKILFNECDGARSTGAGIFVNGIGGPGGGSIITPADDGMIIGNTIKHVSTGMLLTGLCSTTVCGSTRGILVKSNIIDDVYLFSGIVDGDGGNDVIDGNKITNVQQSCIVSASSIPGGAGITFGYIISNNICSNINLGGGGNAAISVGNGLDTPSSFTITGNNVEAPTPQASAQIAPYTSSAAATVNGNTLTGVFAAPNTPSIGAILSGAGITGTPTILALTAPNTWIISGPSQGVVGPEPMAVSVQKVTSTTIEFGGYCTTIPTVVFTGTGSGAAATAVLSNGATGTVTGLTLTNSGSAYINPPAISFTNCNPPQYTYAVRVNNGAVQTTFIAGHEDAGSVGLDLIAGTTTPVTAYGAWSFPKQTEFTNGLLGIEIAGVNTAGYSQIKFTPAGGTRPYQLGVGAGSEIAKGVADCAFLLATNGGVILWRVCLDGNFNINPIAGVASVATLDVNGTGRVAPGTFVAAGACNAASEGKFSTITDSTVNTWGSTVTGGGANHIKMSCNGTNWTVESK